MSKTTLVKVPKLKIGDDKQVAEMLIKKSESANEATKIILDLGLLCFFVKENLNQGQFGPWLQAHCPEKMWRLNAKGKPVASSTLSWQMGCTKSLVEKCKTTVTKLLSQIPKTWEFGQKGEFFQLPESSQLLLKAPEQVAKIHAEASKAIEGKTAYQLSLEFKQGEEDDDDLPKVKRGRLKGQGGATKEQREAARLAEERAEIEAMELDTQEFDKWMDKISDAKGLPRISQKVWGKHFERVKAHFKWMETINDGRKGGVR